MFRPLIAACMASSTLAVTIKSDPICNSAGCTQYLHPKKDDFKKNYFVPSFGRDHDINVNFNSLKVAEKQLGKWDFPTGAEKRKIIEYPTDLPLDEDIIASEKNLKSSEEILGHKWNVTEVFKN